jgi:hypothetical protein
MKGIPVVVLILSFASSGAHALSEMECGSLRNSYGPYDYTNPRHVAENLPIVEVAHFNANVEH